MPAADLTISVPSSEAGGEPWELATTVFLPAVDAIPARPAVLVEMPGAGYNRRYFDLPEPGYSEAEYHRARGIMAIRVPRMAHLHNFAGTRRRLWDRIEAFLTQQASYHLATEEGG